MDASETKAPTTYRYHDSFSGIVTGILFVVAGALIFADKVGMLEGGWFWWLVFAYGIILIGEAVARMSIPKYNKPVGGKLVWGAILVAFSASQLYELENWWPLILIAAGVAMIANSLSQRRKTAGSE